MKFQAGDGIFLLKSPKRTGKSTKLRKKVHRPLVVMEALPNVAYGVAVVRINEVTNLKGFHLPEDTDDMYTMEQDNLDGETTRGVDLENTSEA